MALPVYANDLTTIGTGDLNYDPGTWDESTDGGWDTGGSMVDDEDLWYVDTLVNTAEATSSCTAAQYTKDGTTSGAGGPGTIMYQHNATFTVPTDGIVSIDNYWAAPPSLNPYVGASFLVAEAGVSVLIGSSLGDFDVHYVAGSDKRPKTDGVYSSYFVDPTVTPAGTVGTVGALTTVGIAIAAGAQARGNPNAVQSVRYGRGEVIYTLGEVANPAKFNGYALIDNLLADKFNLLLEESPDTYQGRGLMSFGTAATAVYFSDSDVTITIADDPKVGTNFNKGVVTNASSEVYWTNITIKNITNVAKYSFIVNDSATTEMVGCVFIDLGVFTYGSNSTNTSTTYRSQELITQGGGTFTDCKFDKPVGVSALSADNINLVTKCKFTSDGSSYGADLGTVGTVSLNWDNFESGYVTGTTGPDVGVTPTGNETLLVNVTAGETLTINVQTGASTPSVANSGTGTVSVVAGLVTADWTVSPSQTGYEYAVYYVTASGSLEGAVEKEHTENATSDNFSHTYTYSAGTVAAVQIIDHGLGDFVENISYYPLTAGNQSFTINLKPDSNN